MPEVLFSVQLPDGSTKECYSPSTVVREYFQTGEAMTIAEFVGRSREALRKASERVAAKYGFACSSSAAQLADIEHWSRAYPDEARVEILSV